VQQPITRYAKSGDVSVAYQVFGEGSVNLVLAPFFVSNVEHFWEEPDVSRWLMRTFSSAKATWLEPTTSVATIVIEQIIADFITSSLVDCSNLCRAEAKATPVVRRLLEAAGAKNPISGPRPLTNFHDPASIGRAQQR
jgi:hypothetical protein